MADTCGAKTRSGGACKKPKMENGRCRLHGGLTPKHNTNAASPGNIYSKYLTPEENLLFDDIRIGKVETEVRLMRIRLARLLAAEQAKPELDSVIERSGGGKQYPETENTYKRRDYANLIDRTVARIESLERTRMLLRTELGLDPDDMDADGLTPGNPDEKTPSEPVR